MDVVLIEDVDQLREGGGDPDALLILDALDSLIQDLLDNPCKILSRLSVRHLVEVHEHRDKGRLAIAGHQSNQLILDRLHAGADLLVEALLNDLGDDLLIHALAGLFSLLDDLFGQLLSGDVDERCEVGQGEALSAVLVGGDLGDDLGGHVAGGEKAVGLLDHGLADDRAVLQHVLQVDQIAVVLLLGIVVGVMEVDDALLMGLYDVLGEQDSLGQVLGDLTGHIVALGAVDDRVLVGVLLLDLLIHLVDEGEDAVVRRIGLSGDLSLVAVADILLCDLISAHLHDAGLHHVLDVLDIDGVGADGDLSCDVVCHRRDLGIVHAVDLIDLHVCLTDCVDDLGNIKGNFLSVSLDDVGVYNHFFCTAHLIFSFLNCAHRAPLPFPRPGWPSKHQILAFPFV